MESKKITINYWLVEHSIDTKQIGRTFPQIQTSDGGSYWDDGRIGSVRNLQFNSIPKEDFIDFGTLIMRRSSKASDLVSSSFPSSSGFFIAPFTMEIFSQFNLGQHKYFSASVLHKETYHTYFWLQLNNDFNKFIDFKKSRFIHCSGSIDKVKSKISINSHRQLEESQDKVIQDFVERGEFASIEYETIVLNNLTPNIDIFTFSRLEARMFVTNRLKEAIEKSRLTGFKFTEQPRITRTKKNWC